MGGGDFAMNIDELIDPADPVQVMDVGASAIAEVPAYKALLDRGLARLNAFEGDPRQIASIAAAYGKDATIFNEFLYDGTEQTLHVAHRLTGMTSLLKPRAEALAFFNNFRNFGEVIATERVDTVRLDDIERLPPIDLLKMDIQGAELTVLRNGAAKLAKCLFVQLEVSWICLYENQPAFGEVDMWMRSQGYVPHCFLDVKRWSIYPTIYGGNFRKPGNQLLESDIVYVRDPLALSALDDAQLKKMAVIAHHAFKSADLCVHIIRELISRGSLPNNTQEEYYASLKT